MGFKLACISGRASLIDDNNYYDLEAISQGEFDEDTSNALLNIEGLNKLSANLEKFEPSDDAITLILINFSASTAAFFDQVPETT